MTTEYSKLAARAAELMREINAAAGWTNGVASQYQELSRIQETLVELSKHKSPKIVEAEVEVKDEETPVTSPVKKSKRPSAREDV